MIENKLYKELHKKKIVIAGKVFELEFDGDRRCFRLYQKKKNLGTKSVDAEIQVNLEAGLDHHIHYLERVNQPLPRHSYLLLDATTLQHFLSQGKAVFTDEKETLTKLVAEERVEAEALKSAKLDKETVKRRVWISDKGCYKTCIDNSRGMFIETTAAAKDTSLTAFKTYISGKNYLRRKSKPIIPTPLWFGRQFEALHQGGLEIEEMLIAGADDIAVATTTAGIPKLAPDLVQGLVIFPLFLLMVKSGVSAFKAESQETIEELTKIEDEIDKCQKIVEKFLKSKEFEKEKALECFKAIAELKKSLEELPKAKIEAFSSSLLGSTGIFAMFTAVASFQLQVILNLAQDIDILNSGLPGISASGYHHSQDVGALAVGGKGLLIGGEAIMIIFIATKVVNQMREYSKRRHEMAEVKDSDQLSQMSKEIIAAIEQDKQFYDLIKILGNITLIAGQIINLSPVSYAGMGISIAGVSAVVGAEILQESRHSFDKKPTAVEESISDYYLANLVDLILKNVQSGSTEIDGNFRSAYSKILRNKAFASELFFHLTSTNLAVQKILKEGGESGNFNEAIKAAKAHYTHVRSSHQDHLYKLVETIAAEGSPMLEGAMSQAKAMGDVAYNLLREKLIIKLRIEEKDVSWLRELGEKLSEYETSSDQGLMAEIAKIKGLPDAIVVALNKANGERIISKTTDCNTFETVNEITYKTKALYEEIIPAIQKGFLEHHLAEINSILDDIVGSTEEEREEELKQLFLKSEAKSIFTISEAQEIYKRDNFLKISGAKKSYKAETEGLIGDMPLTIVGKVVKSNTNPFSRDHKKNVYQINPDEFCGISKKAISKAFDAQKYFERSKTFRAVAAMKDAAIVHKATAESLFEKVVEKKPTGDLHSKNVVNLTNHGPRITEV